MEDRLELAKIQGDRLRYLYSAVLHLALEDAASGPSDREVRDYQVSRQQDARTWLNSEETGPGSFIWVCEMLGLNHNEVVKSYMKRRREKP